MQITSATFVTSAPKRQLCPSADRDEFVFIGRSNVGKSSLINMLCGRKWLAKISVKPWKTQLINYFSVTSEDEEKNEKNRYLVDLPGYGYAKVSHSARLDREDMITDYFLNRPSITQICVLIDISITPQTLDLGFIKWLTENDLPRTIVFTKSDKTNQSTLHKNIKTFALLLSEKIAPHQLPTYFITSNAKKYSTMKLLEAIHSLIADE